MIETNDPKTGQESIYLKEHGKVINEQLLVMAGPGHGKTIEMEHIAESLHNLGYLVIYLTDNKDEFEPAYAMFEPQDEYHLRELARDKRKPETKKALIYHPFTFNLPRSQQLPQMEIFTYSVKDLSMEILQFLLETESETTSIRIFQAALQEAWNTHSLHEVLFQIEKDVQGNKDKEEDQTDEKFTGFGTSVKSSGSMKDVKDLYGIFNPFLHDFMIQPANAPTNLNLRKLFRNQEAYHVLSTKYIKDRKRKAFVIYMWMMLLIEYRDLCPHPICLVIDEVPQYAPKNARGYQSHMANIFSRLAIVRNKGPGGMFSLLGSQNYNIDERVTDKTNQTLIGRVTYMGDAERMKKVIGSYIGEIIQSLKRGQFVLKGGKQGGRKIYRGLFPCHAHKEQGDSFIKRYRQEFPDQLMTCNDILSGMKIVLKEHEEKVKGAQKKIRDKSMARKAEERTVKEAEEKAKVNQVQEDATVPKHENQKTSDREIEIIKNFIRKELERAELEGERMPGYRTLVQRLEENLGIKKTHNTIKRYRKEIEIEDIIQEKSLPVVEVGPVPRGPLE